MGDEGDNKSFKIALTGDFKASDGSVYFESEALESLRCLPDATVEIMDTPVGAPLTGDLLSSFDAVVMKRSPVLADDLNRGDLRVVHISRNGVGVEHIDLPACSRAGVMVTNTPESVRRPMASSAMTLILALAHRLFEKNRAVCEGRWVDRFSNRGIGLSGRVLGLIGCGNIGSDLLRLAGPWEMEHLVFDPFMPPDRIIAAGGKPVELAILLKTADFIVLCCPLTDDTYHIINIRSLDLMKRGAFLINVARGPLVDEAALITALENGKLAGAGLDVFDPEPPIDGNPLLKMNNVIATGHNLGFSDESNRKGNTFAAAAVEAVARGNIPANLVNPEVLEHPRVIEFLETRN